MAHNTEVVVVPPTTEPVAPSPAAESVRRHRQRHCDGYRSFQSDYRRDFSRHTAGTLSRTKFYSRCCRLTPS